MTLSEFIKKYNGRGVDFDSAFGYQCVDLYRAYCKEVLNVPQSPALGSGGAVLIATNYLKQHFTRIANTPDGTPQSGDVIIWGTSYGPYGHVAVFTDGNASTFTCFSQNDPFGALCGLRTYKSYRGILGWLRPKSIITPTTMIDDQTKIPLGGELGELEVQAIRSRLNDQAKTIDALTRIKEDLAIELTKTADEAKLWKKNLEDLIAVLAEKLGTTQDKERILPAIDELIRKEDKLTSIADNRPLVSASPIHKLLEEILVYLKLIVSKWKGKKKK